MTFEFQSSLPFVLRWEGGYVNHPADPGGATNKGVTQKVYDAWRERSGKSRQDVRHIADEEVHAIYETGYWRPPHCHALPRLLDLTQFDTAVNMGVTRAVRMLQQVVGVGVDGVFGPATAAAVAGADVGETLIGYCNARQAFYESLIADKPKLGVFRKGWMNRLNALRAEVGLRGLRSVIVPDFGDTDRVERIPDYGADDDLDERRQGLDI